MMPSAEQFESMAFAVVTFVVSWIAYGAGFRAGVNSSVKMLESVRDIAYKSAEDARTAQGVDDMNQELRIQGKEAANRTRKGL